MILTDEMHDSVKHSPVGRFLDRLIREEVARGGDTYFDGGCNVIQALWAAFMDGMSADRLADNEINIESSAFRKIKEGLK